MTNPTFPWPMDEDLSKLTEWLDDEPMFKTTYGNHPSYTVVQYLLHRLKLAEGERDSMAELLEDIRQEGMDRDLLD